MIYTIKLPWPPRGLSPNARLHWAPKAKLAKAYRQDCALEGVAWGLRRLESSPASIPVELIFYPPNKRKRDDDNVIASFKAGRDGIADALGVDDAIFQVTYRMEKITGGYVIAKLDLPESWRVGDDD